ncbi:MAG TPA: HigA family addiction module antitoxin [Afifellaceae bacterium]|nr:HigA family addiction module antitoxin [Afifellaceae bacterium]
MPRNPLLKGLAPSHPGEILREVVLPDVRLSKVEIARRLGVSRSMLYDVLNEKSAVTAEMALRLGRLFGNGPAFWLNLQRDYDLHRAEATVRLEDIRPLDAAGQQP